MRQSGFTLIELMIVVAIVGVLGAIAIVGYDDYLTRSQVVEAIELAAGVKAPMAEYGANQNAWPALVGPTASASPNQISVTITGKYSQVQPTISGTYPEGTVIVNVTSGRASGTAIAMHTTDGGATWTCNGPGTTVPQRHRPQACR